MIKQAPLIAAIDVGTNSFHLITATVNNRGMLTVQQREKESVRLGSSTGKDMKELSPDAIERGVNTLKQFAKLARSLKAEIYAVATSAVREADNKYEFIDRVKMEAGIDVSVISGAEEGRLIYIGAIHALPIFNKQSLVIDIGGGSTETIIGLKGDTQFVHSAKLGSIRITKNFFPDYISSKSKLQECRDFIKGIWSPILKRVKDNGFETVVGASGTITNIVMIAHALKGERIPDITNGLAANKKDLLEAISIIVNAKTPEERSMIPGMDPKRADIILGGALILERAILDLDIKQIILSSYALREGIVFDVFDFKKLDLENHHLSRLRYETILSLCQHYKVNIEHAESVKKIALSIFDDLQKIHKLSVEDREIMEAAAMLHDVGYYISHDQHHRHSYYLISQSIMQGFNNNESEMIALIARYHRKSMPKKKHPEFIAVSEEKQEKVKIMSGILRIAEGVDRRQMQIIKEVKTVVKNGSVLIMLYPDPQKIAPDIELWGADRRKDLLEQALGIQISFIIDEWK
jgi:exopolyphosphatase/guanosine-5'-triphosphate,3'-diphosphate pyrophosphatase